MDLYMIAVTAYFLGLIVASFIVFIKEVYKIWKKNIL
jgi:hypothetical protein